MDQKLLVIESPVTRSTPQRATLAFPHWIAAAQRRVILTITYVQHVCMLWDGRTALLRLIRRSHFGLAAASADSAR